MKLSTFLIFLSYFTLCLAGFFITRLFILGLPVEESYQARYPLGEEFMNLELSASRQIPFLRLHNQNEPDVESTPSIQEDANVGELGGSETMEKPESFTRNYDMYVFPEEYLGELSGRDILGNIDTFLRTSLTRTHLDGLSVIFFKDEGETRGRMREKKVYLYSLGRIEDNEVLSVFVHEFGHYYDIYGLARTRFGDISDRFYQISWDDVDILKAGQTTENFVSGYAMTNQYEDFAESYTYYVLHNAAFREKSLQNPVLANKYAFFEQHTFTKKEFYKRNFSTDTRILPYYWDITKIEIDREKFLQYIKIYL